jgi:transmembrane sensor
VVTITGEAYFEVSHDANRPFRVISNGQTVEVLGTHFNVNTYTDEPNTRTTLLEGSVKVSAANGASVIKPGQQAVLSDAGLAVNAANTEETVAWKNGYFRFNGENIQSIMRKLSRWYDIDVAFDGPVSDDEFSGTISRSKNISEVLKALQYSKTVHFKIEGRRVTVLN